MFSKSDFLQNINDLFELLRSRQGYLSTHVSKDKTLTEMSVMRIVIRYVPTTCNIKRYRNMHLPSIISCKVCYDIALYLDLAFYKILPVIFLLMANEDICSCINTQKFLVSHLLQQSCNRSTQSFLKSQISSEHLNKPSYSSKLS